MERPRVSIVGCGHVGSQAALEIARRDIADLVLFDIQDGLARGRALDIGQACATFAVATEVKAAGQLEEIAGSHLVLVTAGRARQPGMSRADLARENASIVGSIAEVVRRATPDAVVVLVTNPLDTMVRQFASVSGFSRSRVIGMGASLDSARFAYFLAREAAVPIDRAKGMVIGAHDDTMVPITRYATIDGLPVTSILSREQIDRVIERTRNGGAEIVACLRTGSAFFAPGVCAARMVAVIIDGDDALIPASVVLKGEYDVDGLAIGVPCRFSREGLREIVTIPLTTDERDAFDRSLQSVMAANEGISGDLGIR